MSSYCLVSRSVRNFITNILSTTDFYRSVTWSIVLASKHYQGALDVSLLTCLLQALADGYAETDSNSTGIQVSSLLSFVLPRCSSV
jgi:hypothetical protein